MKTMPSPCVRLCRLDKDSGLCVGCLRTMSEIAEWSAMDDGARSAVMSALAGRRIPQPSAFAVA